MHELEREIGLSNEETLDLCGELGIAVVRSHSSNVVEAQADRIRRKAKQETSVSRLTPKHREQASLG